MYATSWLEHPAEVDAVNTAAYVNTLDVGLKYSTVCSTAVSSLFSPVP